MHIYEDLAAAASNIGTAFSILQDGLFDEAGTYYGHEVEFGSIPQLFLTPSEERSEVLAMKWSRRDGCTARQSLSPLDVERLVDLARGIANDTAAEIFAIKVVSSEPLTLAGLKAMLAGLNANVNAV